MLNAFILFVLVETAAVGGTAINCDFPGESVAQKPIRVVLEPRPSLKDQPGLFRVVMQMNGRISLAGIAQPILTTDARDIMISGSEGQTSLYTVGLSDDGTAAFNVQTRRDDGGRVNRLTRIGACHGFESHINRWLPS